jgi:hypothetical protein
MTTATADANVQTLDQLCSFYRGEMSAVESYTTALMEEAVLPFAATLRACQESHRQRLRLLDSSIRKLGGLVPQGSGVWGALTEAIEGTAAAMGGPAAISALAEGEDHGLRDYLADVKKLTPSMAQLIETEILPAQRETQQLMQDLRESVTH